MRGLEDVWEITAAIFAAREQQTLAPSRSDPVTGPGVTNWMLAIGGNAIPLWPKMLVHRYPTQLNSTDHLKVATRGKKLIVYTYPRFLNIQSIWALKVLTVLE